MAEGEERRDVTGDGALSLDDLLPQLTYTVGPRFIKVPWFLKIRHLAVTLFRAVFFELDMRVEGSEDLQGAVLCFQSMRRPDYDSIFRNVVECLGGSARVVSLDAQQVWVNRSECFRFPGVGGLFGRLRDLVRFLIGQRGMIRAGLREHGIYRGVWLSCQLMKLSPSLARLVESRPATVLVFAEMQDMDRVLTWICRERGIPSITMQHGLYAEYRTTETVNQRNYQPKFVDRFLAWGPATGDLIRKYAPEVDVRICGKPVKASSPLPAEGEAEFDVVVILDQNLYEVENQAMLEILKEVCEGKRIGVRPHPQNNLNHYQLEGVTITGPENWHRAPYFVGHTTTLLLDVMQAGRRIFLYQSGAERVLGAPEIEFQDAQRLRELLEAEAPASAPSFEQYIRYTGEPAFRAHREAILEGISHTVQGGV